jgi:hypothetical protein
VALKNIEVTTWDKLDRTLYPNYTVWYERMNGGEDALWIEWPEFRLRITYGMDNLEIQRLASGNVTRLRIELGVDDRTANSTDDIKNAYVELFKFKTVYAEQAISDQGAFGGFDGLYTMNSDGSYENATNYSSGTKYYRIVETVDDKYPILQNMELDRSDVSNYVNEGDVATFTHQGLEWTLQGSMGAVYHPGAEEAVVRGSTVTLGRLGTASPPKSMMVSDLKSWATPWESFEDMEFDGKDTEFFNTFEDNKMYDSYYDTKKLAKFANLVCFNGAPRGGMQTLRSQILRCCSHMIHDPIWGGRLPMETGVFQTHRYNDLHFHYGYIVYAAAVFLNGDDNDNADVKEAVEPLLYTMMYQCPTDKRSDPDWWKHNTRHTDFAPRYMSIVHGHSWAHGLMPMATGVQQESTSEAVNAWYAVYLYGLATADDKLRDIGDRWTSTEMEGAKYWTDVGVNDWIPESALDTFRLKSGDEPWWTTSTEESLPPVVGIRGSLSLQKATWFGEYAWNRHMVQMLPMTPITRHLLSNDDSDNPRFKPVYEKLDSVAFPTTVDSYNSAFYKDGETRHDWVGSMVRTASLMRIMLKDTNLLLEGYKLESATKLTIKAESIQGEIVPGDYFNFDDGVYASLDDGLSYSVAKWFTVSLNVPRRF